MSCDLRRDVFKALGRARRRVQRGWHQKAYALSASGYPVSEDSASACSWCAAGALSGDAKGTPGAILAFKAAADPSDDFSSIERWNDWPDRTQAEVVEAFQRAQRNVLARIREEATQ